MATRRSYVIREVAAMTHSSEHLIRELCMANMVPGAKLRDDYTGGLDYRIPVTSLPAVRRAIKGEEACSRCGGSTRDPEGGACIKCQRIAS